MTQPLHTKITQPLHTLNHATSQQQNHAPFPPKKKCNISTKKLCKLSTEKSCNLSKKIVQPIAKKNQATSRKINLETWLSEWVRKITQPLHTQKSHNLSTHTTTQPLKKITQPHQKHCENRKTLPWEHHISCQMCQIGLSKIIKRVKKKFRGCMIFLCRGYMIFLTTVTTVKEIYIHVLTFSVLLERAIWLIWQPRWCSQVSVLQFLRCFG